jgi:hypothetical protein
MGGGAGGQYSFLMTKKWRHSPDLRRVPNWTADLQ